MTLAPGARLGPYEIQAAIGAGGMGEVYKARDTRLDRTVAIKILPTELSADPERRTRFEREARAVAALSHPHICTLHDIGTHPSTGSGQATLYLVMEYLAGESLAERLPHGPIPLAQALDIGAQIAEALDAAHKHGIIHRDLKPGNVMLTTGGAERSGLTTAKLLDFGLAKLAAHGERPAIESQTHMPTQAAPVTAQGTILGTLQYMAPEQLEGKEADARTDLWALGAILYEMVTGRRAFEGESQVSLIGNIMNAEPASLATTQPLTPPALDRIVRKCLAKHPDGRWDSAHDVADELRWISQTGRAPTGSNGRARYRGWLVGVPCVAAGIVLGALAVQRWYAPANAGAPVKGSPILRGVVELPADVPLALRVPNEMGYHTALIAVSPDGTRVAFVGEANGGSTQLFLHDLSALEVRAIASTEGARHPFFSPDGRWLGFLTADKVKKVPSSGGPSVTLCRADIPTRADWARDGFIYVGEQEGSVLSRVGEGGGSLSPVLNVAGGVVGQVLPDSHVAVFHTRTSAARDFGRIELVSLDSLKRDVLPVFGYEPRIVAGRFLAFVRSGNLMVAPIDIGRRKVLAEPVLAAAGIATDSSMGGAQFAVSESGLIVYAPGADQGLGKLVAVDRFARVQDLRAPERNYGALSLSPDGTRLAVQVGDINDYVWILDLTRQEGRRLLVEGNAGWPVWSPDGQSLALQLTARRDPGVYTVPATTSGSAARVSDEARPASWSPDGGWLAFYFGTGETKQGVVQVRGGSKITPFPRGSQFSFSPDGRFLAYLSYDLGSAEIWVRPLADPSSARQVSVDGGMEPLWIRDHIYYRKGRQFFAARVTALDPQVEWEPPQRVFETDFLDTPGRSYDVSPDGQRLFVVKSAHEPTVSKLVFIQNWFEELKAKLPATR
jgi:serine/threonine-protein kinase